MAASAAGALGALAFPAFFVCAMIWVATLAISRISSVSSLMSVIAAPLVAWGMGFPQIIAPLLAIAAIDVPIQRQRRNADLHRIDAHDIARGRPQHLQRRDAGAALIEIGRHAARNPDARNHQRGKAHQRQEITHLPYEPIRAGRGAVTGADVEPGGREALGQRLFHSLGVTRRIGKGDAVLALVERAGLQQSGLGGDILRDDDRRAELETFGQAIRLVLDHSGGLQGGRADGEVVADFDA